MTVSVAFLDAFEDVSGGNVKLPQSDYEQVGQLAVVDQGKELVAGFTNDGSLRFKGDGPVIVFGDHTRAVKYVDFPFVMGADGVKVLRVRPGWDPKFAYHYLRSIEIPSAGYSRHFKFLKEMRVPKPSLNEQRRIAAILDQADEIRSIRSRTMVLLDELVKSLFETLWNHPSNRTVALSDAYWFQEGPGIRKWQFTDAGVKLLNVGNISADGRLDLTKTNR